MIQRLRANSKAAMYLFGVFVLLEIFWIRFHLLSGLLIVSVGALIMLAKAFRVAEGETWPLIPAEIEYPTFQKSRRPSILYWAAALLGVELIYLAWGWALKGNYSSALFGVVGAAWCWRGLMDTRPRSLSQTWMVLGTGAVMLVAAVFRFWKPSLVPMGLMHFDESIIYSISHQILDGKREIYNTAGMEGQWPYWSNALTLWLFGDSILGLRLSAILSGFVVVGLTLQIGRELGGRWLGLMAGGLMAVATWAVAISRVEYLLASSLIPPLASLWLMLLGLRKGRPLALCVSGFFFGSCASVYNGAKVFPFLMIALIALLWWRQADWRRPLRWAAGPFFSGMLVAFAPLLLWGMHDPLAWKTFTEKSNMEFVVGTGASVPDFLGKARVILPTLPMRLFRNFYNFTFSGDAPPPGYFLPGTPIIDRTLLFMLLAGMATALTRFRKPAYAFLLLWWFLGFLPASMPDPVGPIWTRRQMITLPATMLLVALGMQTLLNFGLAGLKTSRAHSLGLVALIGFFCWYSAGQWHNYFTVINKNLELIDYQKANYVNGIRALSDEFDHEKFSLINFRKPISDYWTNVGKHRTLVDHNKLLQKIPMTISQDTRDYFLQGGLFGALKAIAQQPKRPKDVMIMLTPFHAYLQPFLVSQLGAELVREVQVAESSTGPSWADFGFAPHKGPVHRLLRIKNFSADKLPALESRWNHVWTCQNLIPPPGILKAPDMASTYFRSKGIDDAYKSWKTRPKTWKTGPLSAFVMPDIYYLLESNILAMPPLLMRASFDLDVPADGSYRFGVSSLLHTAFKIDGKTVYDFYPETGEKIVLAEAGVMGEAIELKAGRHRLEVEQVMFTLYPHNNHCFRMLWQVGGAEPETLPLERLFPVSPTAQVAP